MMGRKFRVNGVDFRQETGAPQTRGVSAGNEFVIVKPDPMMAFYEKIAADAPRDVMEIGMYEGGSLVWYDTLYRPSTLVGLDARQDPIEALEQYRADKPHIHTYYARYQEKPGTLAAARAHFPTGIDLVVDDASHLYEQTKETFCMLFPMVRAGGRYVIEDWSWAHQPSYQGADATWADQPAMSTLILELVVLAATHGIIRDIHIQRELVSITKGPGAFTREMMDFSGVLRGRSMPQL